MADATKTVEIIFKGNNQLGGSIATIEDSLGGIGEDAKFAGEGVTDLNDDIGLLGTAGVASIGLLGKAFAALGVAVIAGRFVEANTALEKFQKTMEFATGSTTAAAQEWDYATDVAERFGIELSVIAPAYSKFIAGTKGASLSTAELRTTFEGVAGTLSLVGGSAQDVEEALRQMTQGIGKNRFELEDLKSVAERVPGGMFAIADSLGVTTEALYAMVTAGEFGAEQIRIFAEDLNDGLDGVDFDTFNNEVARLNTAIDQLAVGAGDSGLFDLLVLGVEGATAAVKNLGETFSNDLILDDTELRELTEQLGESSIEWNAITGLFGNSWLQAEKDTKTAADGIVVALEEIKAQTQFEKIESPFGEDFFNIGDELSNLIDADQWDGIFEPLEGIDPFEDVRESAVKTQKEVTLASDKLIEIASDERIANIEASVSLDIAALEADAKLGVAIMESLGETISSTGDLLGSLFGNFLDADNLRQEFKIEEQIDLENARRQEALDKQNELTDAQIANLKEQTKSLQRDGGIITVNGDGLQPHLESFMFEILSAIQVRVNAQGYEMLLGA